MFTGLKDFSYLFTVSTLVNESVATNDLILNLIQEPASFADERLTKDLGSSLVTENSIYVKDVNENHDFKLKCLGKGKVG